MRYTRLSWKHGGLPSKRKPSGNENSKRKELAGILLLQYSLIFTTHNSSVAVASDTDKFMIMIASATKGEVAFSGAIDNEDVRKEVIKYLEGGLTTYKLKYLKYDIPKKLKSK